MQHPEKRQPRRKRGGRKAALWATVLCAALAAAFVLLLPAIKARFPASRYPAPSLELHFQTLDEGDPSLLETVTVSHIAGDRFTLANVNGTLMLRRGEELLDINDAIAEEMLTAATVIAVENVVTENAAEVREHWADMGLAPAQTTVTVTYSDGREVLIEVGNIVPETTYRYYRWSGGEGIYMCDAGVGDLFTMTENRLLPLSQPTLAKTLVDRVTLRTAEGVVEAVFSTDTAGYASGSLQKPYVYPMSAESVSAVLTALENLRLGALEGAVTPDNRASYGFHAPLCVVEAHQNAGARTTVDENGQLASETVEERELRFTFGRAEGDYFYTCEYEGNAYLVSRFLAQALVEANASEWATTHPADLGGAELSAIAVQTGEGSLDIRITRTERVLPNNQLETDEQGKIVYDTVITANGEPVARERLDALVQRLNAMSVSGEIPKDWHPEAATPRWQMTLTTTGGTTRVIVAYALDAFSDALEVDGVRKHYVFGEALQSVLGEWMP